VLKYRPIPARIAREEGF